MDRVVGAAGRAPGPSFGEARGLGRAVRAPGSRRGLGRQGEDMVEAAYEAAGFEVLARNWRSRYGELDVVARRESLVVFCEVKTRSSSSHGSPAEAVVRSKQARMRRLAAEWLRANARDESEDGQASVGHKPARSRQEVRFDVACVTVSEGGELALELIEGAF